MMNHNPVEAMNQRLNEINQKLNEMQSQIDSNTAAIQEIMNLLKKQQEVINFLLSLHNVDSVPFNQPNQASQNQNNQMNPNQIQNQGVQATQSGNNQ